MPSGNVDWPSLRVDKPTLIIPMIYKIRQFEICTTYGKLVDARRKEKRGHLKSKQLGSQILLGRISTPWHLSVYYSIP